MKHDKTVRYNPREMIGAAPKKKTPLGRDSKYRNKVQYSSTSFPDEARRWIAKRAKQASSAGDDSREDCLSAGCTDHISKPIQSIELFEILNKYINIVN